MVGENSTTEKYHISVLAENSSAEGKIIYGFSGIIKHCFGIDGPIQTLRI